MPSSYARLMIVRVREIDNEIQSLSFMGQAGEKGKNS
jgi:hypothetical protein